VFLCKYAFRVNTRAPKRFLSNRNLLETSKMQTIDWKVQKISLKAVKEEVATDFLFY
jgi:hypothetical protein